MTQHRMPVFDADGHVFEDDDQLIQYYEGPHAIAKRNKSLPIFPSLDGWARGVIHEREDNTPGRYSHTDSGIWGSMLESLGAEGSVLFPTAGLAYGLMQDVNFATATATAYNNWLEDRYTSKDGRLFGAGLMPLENPAAATTELRRAATERTNFVTMMMPTVTATPLKLGHRNYWPIYEEAERLDFPIALHGGPSAGFGLEFQRPFAKVHTMSHPYPLFLQLTDLIWEGVFDAFPNLRVVFLEAGCSWVPFMMDRLDTEYDSIFGTETRARLRRRPSEYIRDTDNFWVAAELGEPGMKYAIDAIGSERILYASDFPHEPTQEELRGAVPEFLDDPAYDETAKQNILHRNARNFYRIDRVRERAAADEPASATAVTIASLETRIKELEGQLVDARAGITGTRTGNGAGAIPGGASNEPIATQKSPYQIQVASDMSYHWCACGRSNTQPFCDGSHRGTGLAPLAFRSDGEDTVFLCGCRQSGRKPFCDGSHKKLIPPRDDRTAYSSS